METQKLESPKPREETPEVRLVDPRAGEWKDAGEGLRRMLESVGPATRKEAKVG